MITNSSLTIYHKDGLNEAHLEKWKRYNYDKVWFFGGKNANIVEGYDQTSSVEIRIPYNENSNLDINNFAVGDIIVQGTLTTDIQKQTDLSAYEIYNITSINNNNFGNSQHIHLGGR